MPELTRVAIAQVWADEERLAAKITFFSPRQLKAAGFPPKPGKILDAIELAVKDAREKLK